MAIKVNGTTVVDDSRALSNITNLKTIDSASILGSGNIQTGYMPVYDYSARANVRSITTAVNGDKVYVDGIGVFTYYSGASNVDDDETCFATASGRFLLSSVGLDYLYSQNITLERSIIFNAEHDDEASRMIYATTMESF